MKILIISGTPKRDGLCCSMVKAAADAALGQGVNAEIVGLSDHSLGLCRMCGDGWGLCNKEHRCAFGDADGFNALQDKCKEADAFVFVTPVYWGEVSEAMKSFLDKLRRCQASKQWGDASADISFFRDKPSILVASAGGGGGGIVNTFSQMERAVGHMGGDAFPRMRKGVFDYVAVNRWNQAYKREALRQAVIALIASMREDNGTD